ncbi:MAG: hypothetical protein K6E72_03925 [Saccharofermentans sp.]|nr:hypothetical protein [Saccharofermentans sp.]
MKDNKSAYNSNIYDENIVSTLPYYREYHNQIIDLVKAMGTQNIDWLDTGCGTGTLAGGLLGNEIMMLKRFTGNMDVERINSEGFSGYTDCYPDTVPEELRDALAQ